MDMNPDEAIAAGWLRADSLAAKLLERMSRFSFRRAGSIIALDRFMRDRIVAKDIAPEKVAVIPPWSQDGDVTFDAAGRDAFRAAHQLTDKFVVMYSGNHSPVHPLATVMAAADKLREEKHIVFAFIGGGSEFAKIKKWAEGNPQVLCLPYQPLNQLSASLSAAEAHLVVMGQVMLGLVHPCKIYNMLAVGAPVIYVGPTPSHVTEILQGFPAYPQISVQHDESDALAEKIRHWAKAERRRGDAREVLPAYSKAALIPKMLAAIEP
jgi:glycosyltransferase involved in cell wall biosynthesis